MFEAHFGFSKRPFPFVPRVDCYYAATTMESARRTLSRCIERAEGVGLAVGPSGTGKTLLCRLLAEQFRDVFQVVLLASGRLSTRRALLQSILYEMGQPYRGMDEGELRLAMVDYLMLSTDCPRGMLLLVDEAHTLPLRLLEEVRMITNLVCDGQPRARLVLAGGCLLEERLASPKLDSFSQRIVARCYLESLNREETQEYIRAQITVAGGGPERLMPAEACRAVYQATDGVPRLINQVCDHALLLACAAGRKRVEPEVIEEAWADLQQLPTPWEGTAQDARAEGGIIEFGGLEDESEETRGSAGSDAPGRSSPPVPRLRVSPESREPVDDPVGQVERIGEAISGLDEDFQPAGTIGPELELVFDEDPFSESFREEEVIVDRNGRHPTTGRPQLFGGQDGDEGSRGEHPMTRSAAAEADVVDPAREAAALEGDEKMIIVDEECDGQEPGRVRPAVRVRGQEYGQLFARLRRSS